jgi:hypothetical protein
MEIFTKNSAKCTIFQRNNCNNFSSLMYFSRRAYVAHVSPWLCHCAFAANATFVVDKK